MRFPAPSPRYLGPAAHTSAGDNKPIRRIVLHSTVSPCRPGQVENTAAYFRGRSAGGSAHYVVDPEEVVQVVYDGTIAWHAPPNRGSIGIELCEYPTMDVRRWSDENHQQMMLRAARLVARLCMAYGIPPYYVGAVGLRAGRRGVTTHRQVSLAFRQSSHWDPGAWPRRQFMRTVRAEIKRLKAEAAGTNAKGK